MSVDLAEKPTAEHHKGVTRRAFFGSAIAAIAAMAFYSAEIARHELSTTNQSLAIQNLPPAFQNFRIAQISDIHFDEYTEPSFVKRVVLHLNALKPDLVLLTGDFISDTPLPKSFAEGAMHRCADVLRGIQCTQRFAVMGNHDIFLGAGVVRPILANAEIPVLIDQNFAIERNGQRLWICGANDPVTQVPDLNRAIPEKPGGPVILMSHGPDYADQVLAHPRGRLVDFMLSGHSHGGQVCLPVIGPLTLPTGAKKYYEGLYRVGHMQLYVNRGIGAVGLPLRLNCPPEITVFTLKSA